MKKETECRRIALTDWKLCGFNPYEPLLRRSMELNVEFDGITPVLDAKVPGSVYTDLQAAGLLEDPMYGANSLKCEWVAARWWMYSTQFECPKTRGRLFLVFEGICYKANIYLNGACVATAENAYVPLRIDITELCKEGMNDLKVMLENQPDEYSQVGYTSKTFTQKPRFDYKWDFSTRLINVGMFRPVSLLETPAATVTDWFFDTTDVQRPVLRMQIDCDREISACVGASLSRGEALFKNETNVALKKGANAVEIPFAVENPALWYPNGSGEQALYDLQFFVAADGLRQSVSKKVGIRRLEMQKNEGASPDALAYVFTVNGERTYLKGMNFCPLEQILGTETREKYRDVLSKLKAMNVNAVRVWGGGVIESEDFYELCDEFGILVWQDFMQSSSGIDNYPCHDQAFLQKLRETSEYAVKTRRNHVSLAAFCGGNELMDANWRPVGLDCPNIAMLDSVVKENAPKIPFFPASPSGPRYSADMENPQNNHDIHGEWAYCGTERHYERANALQCLFHTEFGAEALCCRESAEKFLPEKSVCITDTAKDFLWKHHGEWWNAYKTVYPIFGNTMKDFDDFCACSQFIQYEAIRYILESDRRKAWHTSGSFVWQANEPWPNISCTNVIDYYGKEKCACIGIRNAYAKVAACAVYNKLVYAAGEEAAFDLYVINERGIRDVSYSYEVSAGGKIIAKGDGKCRTAFTEKAETVRFKIPSARGVRISLRCSAEGETYPTEVLWLVRNENGLCEAQSVKEFLRGALGIEN